ncbi:MAG: AIR synthase-related protein [Desulfobacula sp.]|nr:AIR synthase-related protein [Desulfobacula sp.]
MQSAIENELVASCHAVARGGLGVHMSLLVMAGGLGLDLDLSKLPMDENRGPLLNETALFSESAGRFIVTIAPGNKQIFEKLFKGMAVACIGTVTDDHNHLKVVGLKNESLIDLPMQELETAFNKPFGEMI